MQQKQIQQPSAAFIAASWFAFLAGTVAFIIGLWNAEMELNEKGYYFTVLMFGLFSAVSVQKAVRDQLEGIPVTNLYYGIAWFTTLLSVVLLTVGLWNADIARSEKGFYAMAFVLSMFAAIAVQKNTRDIKSVQAPDESLKIQEPQNRN
ncbi:MAG TPA: inner membrane protein YiaA [Ferruginibacter sp.]|nr:inner membrane protein YiaA [Ferruginibacter sp.]HNJ93811.1 inner membrane protein YiaA [Ferruginibacter sp.]